MTADSRSGRPLLYILLVTTAALLAMAYRLHVSSIFACTANYADDRYIEYCQGDGYGDYDHGAFFFGLEPDAQDSARDAEVLFLGNSRMQFGFSTDTTDKWFAEKSARHYLLGFSYNEGHVFATDVVRKVRPQARVYVINLDGFFAPYASPIVKTLTNDDSAQQDYRNKRTWQWAHRSLCGRLPVLCGSEFTVFRVKPTGRWIAEGKFELQTQPTSENPAIDEEALKEQTALGHFFLDRVTARRECIILTMVPTVQTTQATAKAIAAAVNLELVSPTLDDLRTFDGSHLDKESAERWSAAFLEAAGPRIQKCLTEPQFSSGLNLDHPQP